MKFFVDDASTTLVKMSNHSPYGATWDPEVSKDDMTRRTLKVIRDDIV